MIKYFGMCWRWLDIKDSSQGGNTEGLSGDAGFFQEETETNDIGLQMP